MTSITAYIITFNESANIRDCINSVHWCDEIVVVDSFSTDDTAEIALSLGARVIQNEWPGFPEQKQLGLSQVRTEWALSLDADERVCAPLRAAIEHIVITDDRQINGYKVPRLNYHLGRFWPHETTRRARNRLSRAARSRWKGVYVHENLEVDGKVERLREPLIHLHNRDISTQAETGNRYSSLKAKEKFEAGERAGGWDIVFRPLAGFLRVYIVMQAFRMGVAGIVASMEEAVYVFHKYAKLWEMSIEPESTVSKSYPLEKPEEPD
jgi:glycosyltransferase involved in cell wall biosynthesis